MLNTIGILSPGDMGHSVGNVLREHELRVIAYLGDRSERTRALAREAQIEEVPSYQALVQEAGAILSILVPAQAVAAAELVAQALRKTSADLLYVDCNAIAPQTVRAVGEIITQAGGRFVDASIVGGPPRGGYTPRIYASGPDAAAFAELAGYGLNIIVMDDIIGHASALKMCYASATKGSTALYAELMIAAKALGVEETLIAEFEQSQADRFAGIEHGLPRVPVKARRFVGEMEEMAKMYDALGLSPNMLAGAAQVYRVIGSTPLADRTPEDTSPFPTLDEVLAIFVEHLND
ncbi:MAG: NAD(P)-dependent oxidoreductase [Anaerolineae bacterium]|nr:NAD(P)-dependent oxidoreductase [Anaerolineae bacterium]